MTKSLFIETYKYMWRSKKNRLFMMLSTLFILVYVLLLLPRVPGDGEVNIANLERDMYANQQQFEDQLASGRTAPSSMTGTNVYELSRNEYVQQRELLTALRQGDIYRYLSIPYRPQITEAQRIRGEASEGVGISILGTDLEQPYQALKNQYYVEEIDQLTFHTVHNRTSVQQLHLFLLGAGPIILLISAVFLLSDILVKDREIKTQKNGVPYKWPGYLFMQSISALSFVLLFFLTIGGLFVLVNGLLHGFGDFSLPIGVFQSEFGESLGSTGQYILKEVGWFILLSVPFLFLLLYVLTRLLTWFSLLVKQPVVVLVLGLFAILFQQFYYAEETTELLGIHLTWFPQTYISFGEVITGRLELQMMETIPTIVSRGFIVLIGTILFVELLVYVTAKRITRQKFVQ